MNMNCSIDVNRVENECHDEWLRRMIPNYSVLTYALESYDISINTTPLYSFSAGNENISDGFLIWPKSADLDGFERVILELVRRAHSDRKEEQRLQKLARRRGLDRLFLPAHAKDYVVESIDKFLNNRDKYVSMGVPWKIGILMYGPPGTGKTSLIRAVGEYIDVSCTDILRCVDANGEIQLPSEAPSSRLVIHSVIRFGEIERALFPSDPNPKIYYLEDIEKSVVTIGGEDHAELPLHRILNAIDGVDKVDGAILFATSNNINGLHEAILGRPGRFQYVVEFANPTAKLICQFIDHHQIEIGGMENSVLAAMFEEHNMSMDFVEKYILALKLEANSNCVDGELATQVFDKLVEHKNMADKYATSTSEPIRKIGIHG